MKIGHLILAHKNPLQLQRLIRALSHNDCHIYIHVDKKVNIVPFKLLLKDLPGVTFIRNRTKLYWGGYSTVMAVANAVDEIKQSGIFFDFINLLSAQDYPIKPVQQFIDYLKDHPHSNFISYNHEVDGDQWWSENKTRFRRYHFNEFNFKGRYLIQQIMNKLLPRRKFPRSWALFGGNCSTWWTIDTACAYYMAETILNDRKLKSFGKLTWGIDEIIFATIIMNSPFRPAVINNNFRYIDWSEGKAHPKILTIADFDALSQSNDFFARKFDAAIDSHILDLVDTKLLTP